MRTYQGTAVYFTSGCYLLHVAAEAARQAREVASQAVVAVSYF